MATTQPDLFPNIRAIECPDLWLVEDRVSFGWIRRLGIRAGTYEVDQATRVSQDEVSIVLKGQTIPALALRSRRPKPEQFKAHVGIVNELGERTSVARWLIPNSVDTPSSDLIAKSWRGKIRLLRGTEQEPGLRSPQLGALHALCSHWTISTDPATLVMPTGTGKTETMLAAIVYECCERIVVVVPSDALRTQISDKFCRFGILEDLGVIDSPIQYPIVAVMKHGIKTIGEAEALRKANVIVTTPSLFAQAPEAVKMHITSMCTHLFIDEAHHLPAKSWAEIRSYFQKKCIVQFTATPFRNDGKPVIGKTIFNFTVAQAQAQGCFESISLVPVAEANPDKFDQAIAHAAYEQLQRDRKQGFTRHKVMVRTNSQPRAKALLDLYRALFPYEPSILIVSSTHGKAKRIKEILCGQYTFIICVDMLKEGFDFADLKIAAVHDLHQSLAVTLQFIGRLTRRQAGLGSASFVVNLERRDIPDALERLYADGTGWDDVIAEVAEQKQHESIRLLDFLDGCRPMTGFDDPDQELNPKIIRPALGCVIYKASKVDWSRFAEAFGKNYGLSLPYVNDKEKVMFFAVQRRDRVKWARSEAIRDQVWDVFVIFHDEATGLLYVGSSDSGFPHQNLVAALTGNEGECIRGEAVFRCFGNIKRLRVLHAGIFKHADRRHRYSKFSGADVTEQLEKLSSSKSKKSDFVGVGFVDGDPFGVGCSAKGKIWWPSRRGTVSEWRDWCQLTGAKVLSEEISTEQVFRDTVKTEEVERFPVDRVPLAMDWPNDLFENWDKELDLDRWPSSSRVDISRIDLELLEMTEDRIRFAVISEKGETVNYDMTIEGEYGQKCVVCQDKMDLVLSISRRSSDLSTYFSANPPRLSFADGSSLDGCLLHTLPEDFHMPLKDSQIEIWNWEGTNICVESRFKDGEYRDSSVQEKVLKEFSNRGSCLVFDDDASGEAADVVAISESNTAVTVALIHCKYSSELTPGARVADLYEVCGQAMKSVKWKWNPNRLVKHLKKRSKGTQLGPKRFYCGSDANLNSLEKALKFKKWEFSFYIVQPGVNAKKLTPDMNALLAMTNSALIDTADAQLNCVFSTL
ncbi:MAG: DEAD/DEAH box helicase family protein [Verrucomicrobiae bacterium]|nr:DEAD/DEAH box helicase family protein [Verrucomicrobiae bacterium]